MNKPVFKWAWEKLNPGDYTDLQEYTKAMKKWYNQEKLIRKKREKVKNNGENRGICS